ncbi:MAG: hypothetical protein ABR980_09480 [Ignavibacteriaceae bacterium]|jgi:hypothetical protein
MALDQAKAQDIWNQLYGMNTQMVNPFESYQNPFSYGTESQNLNTIYGNERSDIERNTNEDISGQQQKAAQSMASRGITGGSLLTDTQKGIASNINKQKYNALSRLGTNQANAALNLQNLFNQNQFDITKAGVGVNQQNVQNQLQQSGLLSSFLNQREQLGLEQENEPGTLADIFSGLQTAAKVGSIPMSGGTSLLGLL